MHIGYASLVDMQAWAAQVMSRECDFPIGGREDPYLERWWIIPRNEQQNVYLHRILRDDDDRALHDHPWENISYVIAGSYREITPDGTFIRQPCVSLFFTGPKVREWGFDCPKGWVHWQDFTAGENGELVGRGCGDMA